MDEAGATLRKRVLPSWMTDDSSGSKKQRTPEKRKDKKKMHISVRKRTVYCMNEEELVGYALEVLNQRKEERDDSEEETSPQLQEDKEDTEAKEPTISPKSTALLPPPDDSDDDPLKFVREIFFS